MNNQLKVYYQSNYQKLDMEKILADFGWEPKKNSTVFIKPNLSAIWPEPGEITHPEVIKSLIKYLQKYNCKIIIGETDNLGPSDKPWDFETIIKNSDYDQFRKIPKVEIINLEEVEQKSIKVDDLNLSIPKIIFDADYYINAAKLKTHWQSQITCSLKNQMGIIPQEFRKIFHRNGLENSIGKLAKAIQPDINIIDGIEGMEGQAPHWGEVKKANMIIVGNNMVEVDLLCAYLIGLNASKIHHINIAQELGVGDINNVNYKSYDQYKIKFLPANDNIPISYKKISVWQEGGHACTGCGRAVELIKKNVYKKHKGLVPKFLYKALFQKTDIILGKVDTDQTKLDFKKMGKIYCIGNCTKNIADKNNYPHLPGCSPTSEQVIEFLLK